MAAELLASTVEDSEGPAQWSHEPKHGAAQRGFPDPLGPITPTNSDSGIVSEMSSSAMVPGKSEGGVVEANNGWVMRGSFDEAAGSSVDVRLGAAVTSVSGRWPIGAHYSAACRGRSRCRHAREGGQDGDLCPSFPVRGCGTFWFNCTSEMMTRMWSRRMVSMSACRCRADGSPPGCVRMVPAMRSS